MAFGRGGRGGDRSLGRVAIVLDVIGDAEQGLLRARTMLENIQETARRTSQGATASTSRGFGGMVSNFTTGVNSMAMAANAAVAGITGAAVVQLGQMIDSVGGRLRDFGFGTLETLGRIGGGIIKTAAEFQEAEAAMRFTFGNLGMGAQQVTRIFQQSQDIAARTNFLTREVFDLTTQLARSGIQDPFAPVTTGAGETITALEALNDLAASKGRAGMNLLLGGLQNFLGDPTGSGLTSLRRRMDLPIEMVDALKDRIDKNATAQEAFNVLVEETARFYGGAGRAMENTVMFQLAQIPDQIELLQNAIGEGALEPFGEVVREVEAWLSHLVQVERETHQLRNVFQPLVEATAEIASYMFDIVKWVVEFATNNPALTQAVIIFTVLAAVVAILVGAFLSFVVMAIGALLALSVTFALVTAFIPTMLLGLALFAPILAAIAAAGAAVWVAWKTDFLGLRTAIERTIAVGRALWELFQTFNGETAAMSQETAEELRRHGMLGFTVDTFSALRRLGDGLEGLWDGLTAAFAEAWRALRPMLVELGILPQTVEQAAARGGGGIFESGGLIDAINSLTPEDWQRIGQTIGQTVGRLVVFGSQIIRIVGAIVEIMDALERAGNFVNNMWNTMIGYIRTISSILSNVPGPMGALFSILGRLVAPETAAPAQPGGGAGEAVPAPLRPFVSQIRPGTEGPIREGEGPARQLSPEEVAQSAQSADRIIAAINNLASRAINLQMDGETVLRSVGNVAARVTGGLGIGES